MGLPAAFAENPTFFVIIFAIGLPLIWWKWRVTGTAMTKAMTDQTHGLRTDAKVTFKPHETGIGTQDVFIMRPAGVGGMLWFALLFFGGGALFYWFVLLTKGQGTWESWATFAGLSAFALGAMVAIEVNQTRIYVDAKTIQKRRVLHRRQTIAFADIAQVDPIGKNFTTGLIIQTHDCAKMPVRAAFSGYMQLMGRLAPYNHQIAMMSNMRKAHDARTSRS